MADLFETVNILSVLLGARRPQWVTQAGPYPNGIPDAASDGVPLLDSPRTQIIVDMREEAHRRSARITFPVVDLTTTVYRFVVDATTLDVDASAVLPADLPALVQAIVDAINADVVINLVVVASPVDSDGDGLNDTVLLRGLAEADYSLALAVIGGTGEMAGTIDPSTATAIVWFAAKPPNAPGTWRQANGAIYAVNSRGFVERFDTAGLDRAYVELDSVTGVAGDGATLPATLTQTPIVTLGPSVLESS